MNYKNYRYRCDVIDSVHIQYAPIFTHIHPYSPIITNIHPYSPNILPRFTNVLKSLQKNLNCREGEWIPKKNRLRSRTLMPWSPVAFPCGSSQQSMGKGEWSCGSWITREFHGFFTDFLAISGDFWGFLGCLAMRVATSNMSGGSSSKMP